MMPFEEMKETLEKELNKSRYEHTLGVMDTAVELAEIHGGDTEKARIAGLLHDCAKSLPDKDKIRLCVDNNLDISDAEWANLSLLHAKCGMILARDRYGVDDEEILHAIRFHTTGCPDMGLLDKIIYVADYIEPNRDRAPKLDKRRKQARKNLDKALYHILKDTIEYLSENPKCTDELTMQTYQFCKTERKKEKERKRLEKEAQKGGEL